MQTDGIIDINDLLASALAVQNAESLPGLTEQLAQIEPCLAGYLENEITLLAGKMSMAGATPQIVRDLTQRVTALVLIVFQAQRNASVRIWHESFPDSPLAKLINLAAEQPPSESPPES